METRLANLTYRGKQKNWDWSHYTKAHIEQHTIAKNLMEHGYSGLDERSKVRHLLTGIQDNAVQPVVCQVLAMREDDKTFTTCLALFANFIHHLKQNPSNMCSVAELGSTEQGGGRGHDAEERGGGGRGRGGRRGGRCGCRGTGGMQSRCGKGAYGQRQRSNQDQRCVHVAQTDPARRGASTSRD
jgi:hypothetical protein